MKTRSRCATAVLLVSALVCATMATAAADSIQSPDGPASVGSQTSMVLDGDGHPVIAYRDIDAKALKLLRCNDPDCTGAEAPVTIDDSSDDLGFYTSVQLDSGNRPVISYYDLTNSQLKLVRCSNTGCTGSQTANVVDNSGFIGEYTSLALDSADRPVIAYHDWSGDDLWVVRCNDVGCAGNDESPQLVDSTDSVGSHASLVLDDNGYPVVAYYDLSNTALKLLHCNDATCSPGGDSIVTVDNAANVGEYASLQLDTGGNPVIAYHNATGNDLKVARCNDPNCSPGGDIITTPVTSGTVGTHASLRLDANDNPVIAYYNGLDSSLELLHCNDPVCGGSNDVPTKPDSAGLVGTDASLVLDELGNPVVAYFDDTNDDLKVLHCNDPGCVLPVVADASADVREPDIVLDAAGLPVVTYHDVVTNTLRVMRCTTPDCSSRSIHSPDAATGVGRFSSVALDTSGRPVVAYHDDNANDLKILHCNDTACAFGGDSITTPDPSIKVGSHPSLVLSSAGHPVVAYYDSGNEGLKLMHCNDPDCSGGDESIESLDAANNVGEFASLALDPAGNPVIAYRDATAGNVKVARCQNARCSDNQYSVETLAGTSGGGANPSLALSSAALPVVAYRDNTNQQLEVAFCKDVECSLSPSIDVLDTNGNVGLDADLQLTLEGFPLVSYRDITNQDLRIARCNDFECNGPAELTYAPDNAGTTGWYTALAIDSSNDAVVAYFNDDNTDLMVYREIANPTPVTCNGQTVTVDLNLAQAPTAGNDVILGTSGNDTINASGGNDTICAGGGDDTINAGPGDDLVFGGAGVDTVFGTDGIDLVYGEAGDDILQGNDGDDVIHGGDGNDILSGNDGNDTINGGLGADTIFGVAGLDSIWGGEAVDTVLGGLDDDLINGEGDNDIISGNAHDDTINGGVGDDTLYGVTGNDTLNGDAGTDAILGGTGNDTINGGDDLDNLSGNEDDDTINGGGGDDNIYGVDGNDTLNGDDGVDTILGGDGTDTISGGNGDDLLSGNADSDIVNGGNNNDTMYGVDGNDTLNGGNGNDDMLGGVGNDTMNGGGGADQMSGQDGDDIMNGNAGADNIFGQGGDDTINSVDGEIDGVSGGPDVAGDTCTGDPADNIFQCEF